MAEHSRADERRIDRLQALATERLGRGAAVAVWTRRNGRRVTGCTVTVYDGLGQVAVEFSSLECKMRALEGALESLKVGIRGIQGPRL